MKCGKEKPWVSSNRLSVPQFQHQAVNKYSLWVSLSLLPIYSYAVIAFWLFIIIFVTAFLLSIGFVFLYIFKSTLAAVCWNLTGFDASTFIDVIFTSCSRWVCIYLLLVCLCVWFKRIYSDFYNMYHVLQHANFYD